MLWLLLGPAGTLAVASGRGDGHAVARSSESEGKGLEHEHGGCAHRPEDRPSNAHAHHRDRCATAHRSLTSTGTAPPTPPAAPIPAARTTTVPAARVPRPLIVASHAPRIPAGQRPPLLAPPRLIGPSHAAVGAVTTNPVSIYVVTGSALLIATAISIAALVLVRRSD